MSTANDADQDSDEASPEASKRSLQEISVSLCQKVNEKLKEFWAMTDFKGKLSYRLILSLILTYFAF